MYQLNFPIQIKSTTPLVLGTKMAHKRELIKGKLETSHRARRPFVAVFIKKYGAILILLDFISTVSVSLSKRILLAWKARIGTIVADLGSIYPDPGF
jgi:hypothetical protein